MESKKIRFNMMIDIDKHRNFKSICTLSGKSMSEVVSDLIEVFISAIKEDIKP